MDALIQARMSSSRLPGKVLLPLAGRPVIQWVVDRCASSSMVDRVLVLTSTDDSDDILEKWCNEYGTPCFRGELTDVLARYYHAAKHFTSETFFRITADCPLIDPDVLTAVGIGFQAGEYDYYALRGGFPDGLDCVAIRFDTLEKAYFEASLPSEREHVGPYIEKHPDLFKLGGLQLFNGLASQRWTLDEPEDYEFLKFLIQKTQEHGEDLTTLGFLRTLSRNQQLSKINGHIVRNEGYTMSLATDGECGNRDEKKR